MNKKIKHFQIIKIVLALVLLGVLLTAGYFLRKREDIETSILVNQSDFYKTVDPTTIESSEPTPIATGIPDSFIIKNFPFQTQAPFANWDALHEETCEEASLVLVYYYLSGKTLSESQMEQELQGLVNWVNNNWDGVLDLTVEQLGRLAKINYDLDFEVVTDSNLMEMKKNIAAGRPVIVPAAGQLLGNPNFRGDGPPYHMVVAIGYDKRNIIVQDVGTRNGNLYTYNQQIFDNAWHDWTGERATVEQGGKNFLLLSN